MNHNPLSRRRILALLPPFAATMFLAACGGNDDSASSSSPSQPASGSSTQGSGSPAAPAAGATSQPSSTGASTSPQLALTPQCADADDVTIAQTEGLKRNSPERVSLVESGITGMKLVIEGKVLTSNCQSVTRALLDFWQCDAAGNYDNSGFKLRGHQFTSADGSYRLETILPGIYTGRTRHIHVKAQAPNGRVLTTQLYFPNEAGNARDGIFDQRLVLESYGDASGGKTGRFDFVLST